MEAQVPATARPQLRLMLVISLAQGMALFLLWRAGSNEAWPSQVPLLNFPLWTLAVALPLSLLLGLESDNQRRTLAIAGGFCAVLSLLAAYIGWQATPWGEFPVESILAAYILPLILACFLALLYLRPLAEGRKPDYGEIFTDSWRNALVAGLSWALALGVTAVLMLWGELFRVIGIEFFIDLFTEDWFLFPVLSVVVGLGIYIFRGLARVIDGISSLLQGLMWLLLPLALTVTALFLATLPFTGLEPLWDTGSGTSLLMALNLFALFTLNAVYQQGGREPYPAVLHRLLGIAVVLLPIISLLALYGLYLRVDQYGWTVARCWALLISLLITLFSLGYAGGIIRLRERWTDKLSRVNLPMSVLMIGLVLLLNSPLLDFRKISLASQQARVERGEIAMEQFDFFDARENMGRPAWRWMRKIIEENGESNPELARLALEPVRSDYGLRSGPGGRPIDFEQDVIYRPAPFAVPEALRGEMRFSPAAQTAQYEPDAELYLFQADLNQDGNPEYVLIRSFDEALIASGFRQDANGVWRLFPMIPSDGPVSDANRTLSTAPMEIVTPEFSHLQVGDLAFRVVD